MDAAVYDRLYATEEGHWWFRGRRAVIWALLGRAGVTRADRLLDAGCGTGRNLVEYGPLAAEVEGIEPSELAVDYCRQRGLAGVRQAGLDALPYEDERFDLLLATDVLEHLEDDVTGLLELRRVARSDAALLITVPAYQWLWSQHDDTHHHFRRYTRTLLEQRVHAGGWRVEVGTYFNTALLPPIATVRMLGRRRPVSDDGRSDYELTTGPLNTILERPMQAEAALIARGASLPAGVSIGMVCRPVGQPRGTSTS